jgi:hypothetical protein
MQAGSAAIPLHCAPACAHGPGRPSLPDGRRVYSSHGIYTPPIRPRRRTSCRPFLDLTVNVQRFNSRVAPLHQKVASERVAPGGVRCLRSAVGARRKGIGAEQNGVAAANAPTTSTPHHRRDDGRGDTCDRPAQADPRPGSPAFPEGETPAAGLGFLPFGSEDRSLVDAMATAVAQALDRSAGRRAVRLPAGGHVVAVAVGG